MSTGSRGLAQVLVRGGITGTLVITMPTTGILAGATGPFAARLGQEAPTIPRSRAAATGPGDMLLTTSTSWGVRLTLNRPGKLNAISHELREALTAAIEAAVEDDDVRVIVIAGAGRAFCSGYDLAEAQPADTWGWRAVLAEDVAATLAVWRCPKPVIAQVHGYALAGGLELAMACDLIVAADDAQLGEPEIRFGSAPVTLLMPFLIGQKRTRELLMTGDLITAAEAERIGLVNRVVPLDRLEGEVDALADRLARVPPDVMAPTKLMLNRAMELSGFLDAVEAGLDLQSIINMSETQRAFDAIVRRDGLKAALAWRDRRYDEQLAGSGSARAAAANGEGTGRSGTASDHS